MACFMLTAQEKCSQQYRTRMGITMTIPKATTTKPKECAECSFTTVLQAHRYSFPSVLPDMATERDIRYPAATTPEAHLDMPTEAKNILKEPHLIFARCFGDCLKVQVPYIGAGLPPHQQHGTSITGRTISTLTTSMRGSLKMVPLSAAHAS